MAIVQMTRYNYGQTTVKDIENGTGITFVITDDKLTISSSVTASSAGSYTAANAVNWNNNAPTTIAAALDRLALKATPVS